MRRTLLLLPALLLAFTAQAQVQGISYTLAPTASYNWFNSSSGLDDAWMVGGRFGLAFGEYVELRATYLQTINQSTNFAGLDLELDESFLDSDVDLARYGAELKLNLGRGNLLPYLLVGGGIQDLERQGLSNSENIFGSLGLGLTLSAGDRYTFGVEGKYIGYSFNAVQNLFDDVERAANDLDLDAFDGEQIGTYAVAANLQFYLGGRRPGQLSELDRQYLNAFGGGVAGLSVPVEPGIAQINWDDNLPYRDLYLAGGAVGLNFGPLIGLRGFYYQGMEDGDLNFDFDDIAIYGGDLRFNLSQANTGIQPYLSLGGGYIDVQDGYNADLVAVEDRAESQGFASGGGGLQLRLSDRFTILGGVRALLTSGTDFEDINSTDQLTTSWMYNAGLNFILGGNNRTPEVVEEETMEDKLESQREKLMARNDSLRTANEQRVADIRQKYEKRVEKLNEELDDALADGDSKNAAKIKREKQEAQLVLAEVDRRQQELREERTREERRRIEQDRREVDIALGRPVAPAPEQDVDVTYDPRPRAAQPRDYYDDRRYDDRRGDYQSGQGRIVLSPDEFNRVLDRLDRRGTADQTQQLQARLDRLETMMTRSAPYRTDNSGQMARYDDLDRQIRRMEDDLREDIRNLQDKAGEPTDDSSSPDNRRSSDKASEDRLRQYEDRIRDLQRDLDRARDRDRGYDDGDYRGEPRTQRQQRRDRADERRLREIEERLVRRISELENDSDASGNPTYRQDFMRDLTDYQSETLASMEELRKDLRDAQKDLADREARIKELEEEQDRNAELRRQQRRAAREAIGQTDEDYTAVFVPNTTTIEEIKPATGGEFLKQNEEDEEAQGLFGRVTYTGMSGTAGLNLGDAGFVNLGLRWHYKLGPAQRIEFMPEAYFSLGSPTTFGLFGNFTTPILPSTNESRIQPYVGIGGGVMQDVDDETDETQFRPAINLLVGSYLPVANGRLFVEFATRNFLNNSQLAAGYRFTF